MESIEETTSIFRAAFFQDGCPIIPGQRMLRNHNTVQSDKNYHIVLSFHRNDTSYGGALMQELRALIPNLNISLPNKDNTKRLHEIDDTDLFIPLLSDNYIQSNELMNEFQTALCRHRYQNRVILFPIIVQQLPLNPAYLQLCLCLFSLPDNIWNSPEHCFENAAIVIFNLLNYFRIIHQVLANGL